MESYVRGLNSKIMDSATDFSEEFDQEIKLISAKAFSCMSQCYRVPGSIRDSGRCLNTCSLLLANAQTELSGMINHINTNFKTCGNSCEKRFGNLESVENINCYENCFTETLAKFSESKPRLRELMKRFI